MTPVYPGWSVSPPVPALNSHPGKQNNHRSCSGPYRESAPPGFPGIGCKPAHRKTGSSGNNAALRRSGNRRPFSRLFWEPQPHFDNGNRSSWSVQITFGQERFYPAIEPFSLEYVCKYLPSADKGILAPQRNDRHGQPLPGGNSHQGPYC